MSNLPMPPNPTGVQGSLTLRRARMQLTKAMLAMGDAPCDLAGFEGLTFFEAGLRTLMRLYAVGDMDAVKEIHNRCFGRVPLAINVEASTATSAPSGTPDELLARLDVLRDEARQLLTGRVIDAAVTLRDSPVSITSVTQPADGSKP